MDWEVTMDMQIIRTFGRRHSLGLVGAAVLLTFGLFAVQADAAAQDDERKSPPTTTDTAQAPSPHHTPKQIDGHDCIDPYDVVESHDQPRHKFTRLHQERIWAVAELDQKRSELNQLQDKSHQKPVPVPVITEADYNARVFDVDSKIRLYEAKQNNRDLTETERTEAHAQLVDLIRQKARAALELTTYRKTSQELAKYDELMVQERKAKSTTLETSSYLASIDEAVGELMTSNDAENTFRIDMGACFVILVMLLIGFFFFFSSRSGSMKDIFKNDRGLQFITLFSLVIAITMFGLLNILEGKELSALLGGLSGYILGRSNIVGGGSRELDNQDDRATGHHGTV
jgi:hypothetical protein